MTKRSQGCVCVYLQNYEKIHPCQEESFAPAAPAWACLGDLLLLLSDLPRGALTGGQRSCSGVEGGEHEIFVFVKKCDSPGRWFPGLGRSPAPPPSPQPGEASQSNLQPRKMKSKSNLLVENHTSLSLPSCIRVQISCDKIGGEETLHRRI